jgi:hydroxyacyl-ACP dehydratase HTD2-like protein with hotdog domain
MFAVLRSRLSPKDQIASLEYRNLAPLYCNERLTVCVRKGLKDKWDVWVEGPDGGLCVRGTAITYNES